MPQVDRSELELALVECLRLLARRGRAVRQGQTQESNAVDIPPLAEDTPMETRKNSNSAEEIPHDPA